MSPHTDFPPPSYSCISSRSDDDEHELGVRPCSDIEAQRPASFEGAAEDMQTPLNNDNMSPENDFLPPSYSYISGHQGVNEHELGDMSTRDVEAQTPASTEEANENTKASAMQRFRNWWTPPWKWDQRKWCEALVGLGNGLAILVASTLLAGIVVFVLILAAGVIVWLASIVKGCLAYIASGGK